MIRILTPSGPPNFYTKTALSKKEDASCRVCALPDTPQVRRYFNAFPVERTSARLRKKTGVSAGNSKVVLDMSTDLARSVTAKLEEFEQAHKAKRDAWNARYRTPTKRCRHRRRHK